MAVRIEKTFAVKQPIDKVWVLLSDPRKVAACVPGAEITEAIDDRTFKGSIKVKVGPSVTDYKGELHIDRLDEQTHQMELAGKGQDVKGRGSASMKMTGKLRALPEGGTEVAAVSEVTIVGVLAQFGSRMINDVSDVIFVEFTHRFESQLSQTTATATTPATAAPAQAAPAVEPVNAGGVLTLALTRTFARAVGRMLGLFVNFIRRLRRQPLLLTGTVEPAKPRETKRDA